MPEKRAEWCVAIYHPDGSVGQIWPTMPRPEAEDRAQLLRAQGEQDVRVVPAAEGRELKRQLIERGGAIIGGEEPGQ